MNLKTFAVSQKLHRDQKLLDYVVHEQAVPLNVIQDAFGPLLETQTDVKAGRLITNYKTLLADEIPIRVHKNAENGFEISGNVPDTMLEAITLVHGVSAEDAVRDLINTHMEQLYGTTCEILHSELKQEAERTLLEASNIPEILPGPTEVPFDESLSANQETDVDLVAETMEATEMNEEQVSEAALAEAVAEEPVEEVAEESIEESVEEVAEESSVEEVAEESVEDDAEEPVEESVEEVADETMNLAEENDTVDAEGSESQTADHDGYDTDLFDAGADGSEEAAEEVSEAAVVEESEDQRFAQAIKRIYEKLVADIRAFGLDKQLNLQM